MKPQTAQDTPGRVTPFCWCCGNDKLETDLVRLGSHPEVGVCLNCARWLQRRARRHHDDQHPSPATRLRARINAVRNLVIRKGWHRHGLLGALLRRLDRHLP